MDYKIKELYEQMELELIASMKRNLKRHLNEEKKVGFEFTQWQAEKLKELNRYQRQNRSIIGRYTNGLNQKISKHLQKELRQGAIDSIKQYNKLFPKNKKSINKTLNKSFFQTNDRKIDNLIKVVNNDLNDATASALRMTNDQYRQVIHKSAFFNANGVMTEKQAVDMANRDFLNRGLNCIEYKDGRRVNIASYSQMAVRTASLRAQLMGEGDFRKSIGRTLVKVTTHGGACKICTAWQGAVLVDDVYSGGEPDGKHQLLSEAMKQGFLHPSCRHGLTTYYPELEGIKYDEEETDEEIDDALRDKLNYYDRQEQANIRKSKGFLDKDNVKEAKDKILACEKKKNELVIKHEMPYKDVTNIRLEKATPKSHNVRFDNFFIDDNKVKHPIKGIEKIAMTDKNSDEYKMAKKIREIFGGKIHIVPRIETEKGYKGVVSVKTPDYIWNNEKWDLKTPGTEGEFKNSFERFLKKKGAKKQAKKYIIDYIKFPDKSNEEILNVIESTLIERDWVEEVIVMKGKEVIKIYSKI